VISEVKYGDDAIDGFGRLMVLITLYLRVRREGTAPHGFEFRRLRYANHKHDDRLDHHVDFRRQAEGVDGVGQGLDDQRADHAAGQAEFAAGQRGAAQRDGQDGVQFQQQAGVVGVGALDVGSDHQARQPAQALQNT
jgi:hypothetical protein